MLWIDVGDSTSKIQPAKSLDYSWIRRPRPSPRQGRRLGPPQVWNLSFLASSASMLRGSFDQISLPFASTVLSRSHPSLLLGGPAAVRQALRKATSIASSGRSSLPFARRYTLQTLQTLKHSLGMPHPAANRHPKATSMASYGRPSLPVASP